MRNILKTINNYFYIRVEKNKFVITNNEIKAEFKNKYSKDVYIEVVGSCFNDGIYKIENYSDNSISIKGLIEENFEGAIYTLAIPRELVDLELEIKEYKDKNKKTSIVSESFGNYSYSKATDSSGGVASWQKAFADDLKVYKNIVSKITQMRSVDYDRRFF